MLIIYFVIPFAIKSHERQFVEYLKKQKLICIQIYAGIVVTFIVSTRSQLNCAIGAEVIKRGAPQGTVALPRNRAWWEELRPEALRAGPNIPVTTRSSNTIINNTVIIKTVAAAAAGRRLVRTAGCRHQDPLHEGTSFSRM